MKPTLELPITIRFPEENEIPMNSSVLERLRKSKSANIVEGYTLNQKQIDSENKDFGFEFYAEINVNNSNLWNLLIALTETLPEVTSLLFGHIDFEINYGNYEEKKNIIEFISQYKVELTQDAFINFGLIYQDEENLIEIFIDESKYVKYWGVSEKLFKEIMGDFKLEEIKNIEFIDEYPKVRESLRLHNPNAIDSNELIQLLKEKYL